MKIVMDTNILLVTISATSKYHFVFQDLLQQKYTLCVTTDILNEYEEIISQHLGHETAKFTLELLQNLPNIELITKYFRWQLIEIDPDDNKFVDCAISANADFITTNDKHFNILEKIPFPKVNIIDFEGFMELLKE